MSSVKKTTITRTTETRARSSKRDARALSNGRGSTTVADWRCDGYEYYTIPAASSDPEDTFLRRRCPCVSVFPVCRQVSAPYAHPPRAPGDTRRWSHGSHPSLVAGWLRCVWGLYVIIIIPTISFFYDYYYYYFHNRSPPHNYTTTTAETETYLMYLYAQISWWSKWRIYINYCIIIRYPCALFEHSSE